MSTYAGVLPSGNELYIDPTSGAWKVVPRGSAAPEIRSGEDGADCLAVGEPPPVLIVYKLTHKCNLSCSYCYDADYASRLAKPFRNSSVRTTLRKLLSVPKRRIGVVFHGGEPLLHFDEIQSIVQEFGGLGKHIEFGIQTNGTLLSKSILNYLNQHRFGLSISLDGSDPESNRERGSRVFSDVYEEIINFSQKGWLDLKRVNLTITVGDHNVERLPRSILDFEKEGFGGVSFSSMHDVNDFAVAASAYQISNAYSAILDLIVSGAIKKLRLSTLIQWIVKIVTGRSSLRCISRDCGAGDTMKVVSPDGTLLPCDVTFFQGLQYSGIDEMDRSLRSIKTTFAATRHMEGCSSCGIRAICPGPCPGNVFLDLARDGFSSRDECLFLFIWIRSLIDKLATPTYGDALLQYCRTHLASAPNAVHMENPSNVQN